jgi:hypothetical protein
MASFANNARDSEANRAAVVERCRALRETLPVTYRGGIFMSAHALTQAYTYELAHARSVDDLAEVVNCIVASAERGLVPYHSARHAFAQVQELLESTENSGAARDALENFSGVRINARVPIGIDQVTTWTLTRNDQILDAKVATAAMECRRVGYAVIDGLLGQPTSQAVRAALTEFEMTSRRDAVSHCSPFTFASKSAVISMPLENSNEGVFIKGELDQSERRILGDLAMDAYRDDSIAWLTGAESGMTGAFAQFMRVTLLNPISLAFAAGPNPQALAPVDSYVSNAMLSVYEPGARGFVPHVDNCGTDTDPRALTAVYYPCGSASPSDGGALTLFPGDIKREMKLTPTADRLVLFASATVPHAVEPLSINAQRRFAVSFWYVGDPEGILATSTNAKRANVVTQF